MNEGKLISGSSNLSGNDGTIGLNTTGSLISGLGLKSTGTRLEGTPYSN